MTKRQKEIVSFKPGIFGVSVDMRELARRLVGRPQPPDPVLKVAERFVRLCGAHGIPASQIPRIFPEVGLDTVRSPESLLSLMTPDFLQKVANFFEVRQEWLEGTTRGIYSGYRCYKRPIEFFEQAKTLDFDSWLFPAVALCSDSNFHQRRRRRSVVTLVLRDVCSNIGSREIHRYRIFTDGMEWDYWKCRHQILVMVRAYYEMFGYPIPIYLVEADEHRRIIDGLIVPRKVIECGRRLTDVSLEDFSLFDDESAKARGGDELRCAMHTFGYDDLIKEVESLSCRSRKGISKFKHSESCQAYSRVKQ